MPRLLAYWDDLRSSMWFVPALLALAAVSLSAVALVIDGWLAGGPLSDLVRSWSGGPDGARELLGTIAGSMITIAGVTFSIVVVALVLASNQFAPRLLRNFMRDGVNQVVLGSFVATFLYALLVLRGVRSGEDPYVPSISVTLALLLAVLNLGLYIYFIHHITDSMQITTITQRIAQETHEAFDRWLERGGASTGLPWRGPATAPEEGWPIRTRADGYVQAIDLARLTRAARDHGVRLDLALGTGDFATRDAPVAWSSQRAEAWEELEDRVRSSFVLGSGRTLEQDPGFGVRQLVDVAVKALSPGINDPSTATTCIDYLGSVLLGLARRKTWPPPEATEDQEGNRVLVRLHQASLPDFIELAVADIARYGRSNPEILLSLVGVLEQLAPEIGDGNHRRALSRQAEQLRELAEDGLASERDRERVEERLGSLEKALGARSLGEERRR